MIPIDPEGARRLDDPAFVTRLDPSGMLRRVAEFPAQFAVRPGAAEIHDLEQLPPARHLWIAAMGGSAFAGEMLAAGLYASGIETSLIRGYQLPAAAQADDWLLAMSYSGNTEEVLSVFEAAEDRGLRRVAIASGGELARRAGAARVPLLMLTGGSPPRAAAGYGYAAAFEVGARLLALGTGTPEWLTDPGVLAAHLSKCADLWGPDVPAERNEAKRIALALDGRLAVVYCGVGPPEAAALRWRTQINENAKALCHTAAVPELDHNEVVGWSGPDDLVKTSTVVFLREGDEDPGTRRRLAATREWLDRRGVTTLEARGEGESPLERLWWLCHLGDWVSVYLGALRGVDPTPVTAIDELKSRLSAMSEESK
jgi:glucose/mannose-6-phosphate isomerase